MVVHRPTLLAVATAACCASMAPAALIGTSVTGVLNFTGSGAFNFFDPVYGYVPTGAGYLNTAGPTVTVAEPATEFAFQDMNTRLTVNVTDTQVLLQEQSILAATTTFNSLTIQLTGTAFSGKAVAVAADTFPGTTAVVSGNTLTISVPLHPQAGNSLALALYNVTVPEPTTALAMAGAAVFGLRRRRRCRATQTD